MTIEHIAAYSPQARGRCERMFRTLQDRLPKELALAGIIDLETANRFIAEVFLPAYNARFAIAAAEPGSAFAPPDPPNPNELCQFVPTRSGGLLRVGDDSDDDCTVLPCSRMSHR